MSLELRDYQRESVDAIYQYFRSGKIGNPLIVAPTGSGKSIIIAKFIEEVVKKWPAQRVLMLAHRKELLEQNFSKLVQLWADAPVGIYSAGLKSRNLARNITIAGINSIYNKANELGWQDLILIDECHLVPSGETGEGMYRTLIAGLQKFNANLKVIGFTATPYRMKTGSLVEEGGIFSDIAFDIDIKRLVAGGYLAPLISKKPKTQAKTDDIKVRGGEFVAGDAERVMDVEILTQAAIDEMETYLSERKSWIVFCSGIKHAEHVTKALNERGHEAECIVGDTEDMFRASTLDRFKKRELKVLVNCDVLTTGFDAPNIDALVILRPTKSTGLYVQICGRGMRLFPDKKDCLVLDFAGNIERHGPIDEIKLKSRAEGGTREGVSAAPVKVCPECQTAVAISIKFCPMCNHEFPAVREVKHEVVATTKNIMSDGTSKPPPPPKRWAVTSIEYKKHEKAGKPPSLRVIYTVSDPEIQGNLNFHKISEWVSIENPNKWAYAKAIEWWKNAHKDYENPRAIQVPWSVDAALKETNQLRPIKFIVSKKEDGFDRIVLREFGEYVPPEPKELNLWGETVTLDNSELATRQDSEILYVSLPENNKEDDYDLPF